MIRRYADALHYLNSFTDYERMASVYAPGDYNLERMRRLLDDLELGVTVAFVIETDDRVALAESIASGLPQVDGRPADPHRILASPHVLIGTIDDMATTLQERRDRWGFSYVSFVADAVDTVAPLVNRLAGT